ncbi:MAG: MFS transporter [Chitinophagales bacterium]|nr:MFS transporter [Chitinophagales bacterium]
MTNKSGNYIFPLTVIGILFFIFGFITWANSQLIPYLRTACQLTYTESYFVTSAFFAAYFFMSIPSSYILKWLGFKKGMAVGLFIMAVGAGLFIPAAKMIYYPLFLTGLFIMGTGVALLQTASNPYVTILGPIESAAQRISIMGVCNKLAGFIAVHLLGFLFMDNIDEIEQSLQTLSPDEKVIVLQDLAHKVIHPYIVITILFVILGILLIYINLPEPNEDEDNPEHAHGEASSVFGHRNLVLGAVAIFCYIGIKSSVMMLLQILVLVWDIQSK